MQQPHQHGPQCRHGHGAHGQGAGRHGHGGHGHGHSQGGPVEISPKQYFQKLTQMKSKNPQFYWMEILTGNYFNKWCQQKGFDIVRSLNGQVVTMVVAQAQMMITCQWLPLTFRPFVSGLFCPLFFLLFFNFNVIFGVSSPDFTILHLFSYLALLFYTLTALRSPGILSCTENFLKTQQAIKKRPYLQNQNANCPQCKILKVFRSTHCPICKVCVSKFTRHSLAFGSCIGSSNQLLAWVFFTSLALAQFLGLYWFFSDTDYGIITNLMFYALNLYIFWISFVQSATIFVMNFMFGITQHETKTWVMTQYLQKAPQRQFINSLGKGLLNNLIESVFALVSIPGYESQKSKIIMDNPMQQQIPMSQQNGEFQKIDLSKTYFVNWSKAFFYLLPQIPTHPCRDRVVQIMARDQPRMLEMYKLQKKFRQDVMKQTEGQQLNEFQIQQKVGMKMQQHMMKSAPHMMPQMAPQTPEQQKAIQIQMMTHMIGQLSEVQPAIAQKIKNLLQELKQNKLTPMQVGAAMRQVQQELMKAQMEVIMKQREEAEKLKQSQQQNQDEEQQLKKQQVPDEDL